jgi:hypothetical protein
LLDITTGGRVLRIERLRMANGEPMAIETTHLSAKRFPALRRSLVKYTSLYTALAEVYGVHLAEAEETIETSLATPREAGLLGTDVGLPMLMLSRHSVDKEGLPVEWVRSVYRGDRYKFVAACGVAVRGLDGRFGGTAGLRRPSPGPAERGVSGPICGRGLPLGFIRHLHFVRVAHDLLGDGAARCQKPQK